LYKTYHTEKTILLKCLKISERTILRDLKYRSENNFVGPSK